MYTLFENGNRQPPSHTDLLRWENDAYLQFGETPFRVLGDPGRILINGSGGGSLPMMWILNEKMVIEYRIQGARIGTIINLMEEILQ